MCAAAIDNNIVDVLAAGHLKAATDPGTPPRRTPDQVRSQALADAARKAAIAQRAMWGRPPLDPE